MVGIRHDLVTSSTDNSTYFAQSLEIRGIESRLYTKIVSIKLLIFSFPPVLAHVLGAQKNRLTEMVPLSTHNICFG